DAHVCRLRSPTAEEAERLQYPRRVPVATPSLVRHVDSHDDPPGEAIPIDVLERPRFTIAPPWAWLRFPVPGLDEKRRKELRSALLDALAAANPTRKRDDIEREIMRAPRPLAPYPSAF